MSQRVYMDYNATAPLRHEARDAMQRIMEQPHNASSVHSFGREAHRLVEDARRKIAALVEAPVAQVVFNSGSTEGNNTVLQHFAYEYPQERILISAIEHSSVLDVWPDAGRIPVTPEGLVDLNALERLLKDEKTSLVSVMLVNNETGVIQPVAEAAALAHKHGALFHCDAVQAAGRIPINMAALGADFLTLSAHKIGGPQGVGALVMASCGVTPVLLSGGGQEKKARAGTENVAGIAGFGIAADLAQQERSTLQKRLEKLRDSLEKQLCEINRNIIIHGKNALRVTNTTMFSLPGTRAESLLIALDLEGIAVSNGSACSSGTVRPSRVLQAMGADDIEAGSVLRISLGWATKDSDIERFIAAWEKIHARLKK